MVLQKKPIKNTQNRPMNEKDQFQHKPKVESNENTDSFT